MVIDCGLNGEHCSTHDALEASIDKRFTSLRKDVHLVVKQVEGIARDMLAKQLEYTEEIRKYNDLLNRMLLSLEEP